MTPENFNKLLKNYEKQLNKDIITKLIKYGFAIVLWVIGGYFCIQWFDFKLLLVLFILLWANNID